MSNENDNAIMLELYEQYKEGKLQFNNLPNVRMGQMGQPQNPIQPPMQQNQPQVPENWNLTFERKENNDRIEIQISTDKFLEEAFNRYRIKSLITTGIKFTLGGKPLNENLKISKSGLHNNATIIVENDSNNNNPNNMNYKINVPFIIIFEQKSGGTTLTMQCSPEEKICDLLNRYKNKIQHQGEMEFIYRSKNLNENLTVTQCGLKNGSKILVIFGGDIEGAGYWYMKEINIKFIKVLKNNIYNNNLEIEGILKLCLLKEVSQKISRERLGKLPDLIKYIIEILSNNYIRDSPDNVKQNILDVLKNVRGSNILNLSNFVDEIIDQSQLNNILKLLNNDDLKEMNNIKCRLSNYNNCIALFNKEYEKSKKESIFEFSVVSLVIIEREDFEKFENERKHCQNRVERILYHGTSIKPISEILTGLYKKSMKKRGAINGEGVYFTDSLDYGWFYGGKDGNRANFSGIPKIRDTFTVIVNSVYYDKTGFQQVKDSKRTPGKNQINFAYAGARSERLDKPDKTKFIGTEYVIYDLDQICPFMAITLIREEYCVIWRDNNFSSKPVYNNEFDKTFKEFLKERLKYINQYANYNIYPCETTEEALELVNRKKYNKIILLSNVGTDLGGKKFVDKAREIIENDVIVLFLAYRTSHLKWIKQYKNALFSNEPKFYEEYLKCFDEGCDIKNKIQSLINNLEKHYNVKFNFDDKYLDYPLFKEDGKYSELRF